jgi:hypothetical protein
MIFMFKYLNYFPAQILITSTGTEIQILRRMRINNEMQANHCCTKASATKRYLGYGEAIQVRTSALSGKNTG